MADTNQLEGDDLLPVSLNFTVEYGPARLIENRGPGAGTPVQIVDEDGDLFSATVETVQPNGTLWVRVRWDTRLSVSPSRDRRPAPSPRVHYTLAA
jgi:hypothetical protein